MTRARKNSPDEKTLSLSTLVNSASQDSILDSITVKATPTPSSSPPTVDEPITEAEAEIDLNHERRKRCKRIPPLKSLACELDSDTGSILGSSPAQTPGYKDKFEVSYNCPILKVHALNELGKEHLSKFKDLSLSPVLPPASVPPDSDISSSSGHSLHRARTYYQRETGIFTIKSSPQPTQLSLRSAFTVLGKLQDTEAPSRKSKKIGQASNKKRAGKTKDKEKERVEESGDIQPTVTNAASIDLKSCIAEEKPLHLFPEKPVVHPFFNVTERKRMAQSSLIQKPAISDNSKTLLPAKDESRKANSPQLSVSQHPNQSNRLQSGWNLTSTLGMRVECRAAKLPGLTDAPWPIKRTSHIRGLSTSECNNKSIDTRQIPQKRRLKEASITLTPQESVLNKLSVNLGIGKLMDCINSDDYEEQKYLQVAPEVKLPTRQVMTGQQLQDMVRSRVSARLPHLKALYSHNDLSDSDSSDDNTIIHSGVHPALLHLYKRLGSELTAFDKHQSETIPWEVKYAPQSVGEILQVGREMDVCRRWLLELRTDSLISGKGKRKAKGSAGGSKNGAAKKKRRKKDDDLDSFVVSEEDERTLMSDITDSEEDDWTKPVIKTKKSTIRKRDKPHGLPMISSKDSEKKTNAIVISGPNGCGKTAAVYAIAKELGYAVFEVNPGSRRTGKDVLDQVGDMAKNHLVHQANTCDVSNPFTKAKTAKEAVVAFEDDIQLRQQQSLILFEEVDILFEEDKNFWSTVLSLLSKSKRPIVLTCNDESHLPWDELSLHAVLRFSMPSRDLLVDHLLLICANEGHLIQRSAIDVLVVANKFDIRASIMNLQFYCRMAIGDHTGGFNWIIDRWPVGSDTTEDGEKLRVVSENTYYEGMGWVLNSPNASEEHRWRSVWEEYALDIGATGMGVEECTCEIEQSGVSKIESLKIADGFFEARSAADTFALNGLCTSHKVSSLISLLSDRFS
jgi:DNA polymerase III delta prime subunit